MKRAISVSLGSNSRDSEATVELLGQTVSLKREGWNGDEKRVKARFEELDGEVDALGVGGIDLWLYSDQGRQPYYAANALVSGLKSTPVVDGSGLKNTLERRIPAFLEKNKLLSGRNVLVVCGCDRFGLASAFYEAGFDVLCGDLGFALGMEIPIRDRAWLNRMVGWLCPVLTRLPISMLYPTGDAQLTIEPKFTDWYAWADVIAGDFLYIKKHMPDDLSGKLVVTNTTTDADRALLAQRGVRRVVTTTPSLNGRTFGTNLFEAALTAASGKGRALEQNELEEILDKLNLEPTIIDLGDQDPPLLVRQDAA